jgi:hypothetical protein
MGILKKASNEESGKRGRARVAGVYPSRVHRATTDRMRAKHFEAKNL